ncbi:MAG: efflux RND transporter permease subunit, partial [Planctomycetota bacterium]
MSIVAWFARNPVASNLLMLSVVGTGFLTLPRIKREIFPEFSIDTISVAVAYPGASPEEVEESICIKVEEEVEGVDGVERVSSTASEGGGLVLVELLDDADNQKVLDDIKSR